MPETAEVLNGTVKEGDTVAYATRRSSSEYMHIGKVLEVFNVIDWQGREIPSLRVEVTKSSDSFSKIPRKVVVGALFRVVKVS